MSLGITPPATFEGVEATAQHLQRSLGSPASDIVPSATLRPTRQHVDPNLEQPVLPSSPPRRALQPRGPRVPPLQVDVGESSMRDGRVARQDSDAANLNASHQTAQRFADEINRLAGNLEAFLRQMQDGKPNKVEGSVQPQDSANDTHMNCDSVDKGRKEELDAVRPQLQNGNKNSGSHLSLSSRGSVDNEAERPVTANHPKSKNGEHFEVEDLRHPAVLQELCDASPQCVREQQDTDFNPEPLHALPDLITINHTTSNHTDAEVPCMCEFKPLGHDIENFMNRHRLASLLPVRSVSSNMVVSPPWSESPTGVVVAATQEIASIDEGIAALEGIRNAASKVHRCVMDEIFEARQSVDELQRRISALAKTHDQTVQRLLAATSKLQTTSTMLQHERSAMQSVLLRFGAASSPTKGGGPHVALPAEHGCASPSSPGQQCTEPSSLDDEDELDENELFGSPKRSEATNGHNLRFSTPDRSPSLLPSSMIDGSPWSTIPDDYPNDPRLVSILMLPHDMANDVLRSRRQLKKYVRLVSLLPSALREHHEMLLGTIKDEWIPEANAEADSLFEMKERLYESARLRLEGEL